MSGPQRNFGGFGGEDSFALSGIWTPELPVRSESQCRLRCSGSTLKNKALIFYCRTGSYVGSKPIPVATRSKAWVCSRLFAGIVGSNSAGGMDVCLLWVLRVFRYRSQRPADHSSRGVLPSVVCLRVIVKPRYWSPPGAVAPWAGEYLVSIPRHFEKVITNSEEIPVAERSKV